MRRLWTRIVCGVLLSSVAVVLSAAPPSVLTKPLGCVAPDRNARVSAKIQGKVKTARVMFRAHPVDDTKCEEYFVEMRQSPSDPTVYWALLPIVAPGTRSLSYQVRVDPGNGESPVLSPSEPLTVAVREGCVADPLSEAEQRTANNLILGLTSSGQTGAPCGFRCNGITTLLTTANELRPNEECLRLAAGTPWYKNPEAGIFFGAALINGIHIWNHLRDDDKPVSPARP
jgi:hypothetical protein